LERRFDIAIIGGGINGTGIARDAAGRGWSVVLIEQRDLAGATSSASTKLIHGGLRYLEFYEFRLVREALAEREVLLRVAPHIIWPLRFVLPHDASLRPAWLLRLGLFLYDHLGGRELLPGTRTLDLRRDPAGAPLQPRFAKAFEYSDCWVEDARLVVLNARDAAERGAAIRPRTTAVGAERFDGGWRIATRGVAGETGSILATALVNAGGPWVGEVRQAVLADASPVPIRRVKGSHIVVPKLWEDGSCYIFQNSDRRIFFAIPYETGFTLIGTTEEDFVGDPAAARASDDEIAYLCAAASGCLARPVRPSDVVWSYAGVRPLYDDGASAALEATREYVLRVEGGDGAPPLLSVIGGKITTYRRLAEAALEKLAPHLPARAGLPPGWTGETPLPGGDFPHDGFEALVADLLRRRPWLAPGLARRLARAYGTRTERLLDGIASERGLGQCFGADLTEAELRYLIGEEWAVSADDVLWRRTKLGLRLRPEEAAAVEAFMRERVPSERAPALRR